MVLSKKLSKREKEQIDSKKDSRLTTWFCFILGIALSIGGFKRLFSGYIGVNINPRTNYPILSNGFYPTVIGVIFILFGFYRIFFLKKK